ERRCRVRGMAATPSAQYSLTIRVEIEHKPGMLGRVATAIGEAGGTIGSVDLVKVDDQYTLRDITVDAAGPEHWEQIVEAIDALPLCLDTKDPDEIVATVKRVAPGFGGINLEDISAPRCFAIEERLKEELDIPVFHDDQHGTAIVTLAALLNAVKITGKRLEDLRVLIVGLGAAGIAVSKILLEAGVRHVIGCDSRGAVHTERADYLDGSMNAVKRWYA